MGPKLVRDHADADAKAVEEYNKAGGREMWIDLAWALVNSPHGDPQAWTEFTAVTEAAKARYNATYQTAVIQAAELKPDGDSGS